MSSTHFWVRRTQGTPFTIADLGVTVAENGGERNLHDIYDFEILYASADLQAAISGAELVRLDGPSGSPIPAAQAFYSLVLPHSPDINEQTEESVADDNDFLVIYDASAGAIRKQKRSDFLSTFGVFSSWLEDDTESSTTSKTWIQKLRLTTPSLVAGTYRIGFALELYSTLSGKNASAKVELDDTTELATVSVSEVTYRPFSTFTFRTLSAGVHTIDVDYSAPDLGVYTAYIRRVKVEFWRMT